MDVLGFLLVEQLAGPPLETRHLILPEGENPDEPHLIVLLNKALTHDDTEEQKTSDSKVKDQTSLG